MYNRGQEFRPVLSRSKVLPGASLLISLENLSLQSFVSWIPSFELMNRDLTRWMADRVVVKPLSLERNILKIDFDQDSPYDNIKHFEIVATVERYPGRSNQLGGAYLQCHVTDYVGRNFEIRIRHNGVGLPQLQVNRGAGFEAVTLVSYDGFRLSWRYSVYGTTSTVYLAGPSDLA